MRQSKTVKDDNAIVENLIEFSASVSTREGEEKAYWQDRLPHSSGNETKVINYSINRRTSGTDP